jgi:cation transport ATPase
MAKSTVGIAIGADSSDLALENAHVVLMEIPEDLKGILAPFSPSH